VRASPDVSEVLAATVTSLRAENKLLVYQLRGETTVSVRRSRLGGLLRGQQQLVVPAAVSYYVDLSGFGSANVSYNPKVKAVSVQLPRLAIGEVTFRPEGARTLNGGLLTFSQRQVDGMLRTGYGAARRSFMSLAQRRSIVRNAEQEAARSVEAYFAVALRAVGRPDVKVVTVFVRRAA
jgi:hypothetical protein